MLKVFLPALIIIGIAVAGIAIKMFLKKNGEFRKQCGSVDPSTGRKIGCTCEKNPSETCHNN